MAKGSSKNTYRVKCSFPDCKIKKNSNVKGLSIHTLPKNASKETVAKWAKVVPNVVDKDGDMAKAGTVRYTCLLSNSFLFCFDG